MGGAFASSVITSTPDGLASSPSHPPRGLDERNIVNLAVIILSAFVAVACLGSGAVKIAGAKQSLQIRDQLGVSATLWRVIGVLEDADEIAE